ncbi:Down syndrome cell adhesion molecule-like protein Dscam2 [Amphibalanus amphitrite]|uniref:Down syndrome cell adhesion molecule-like protein Dscam2 n=1 Tax=Amphibalanus amphitrite TaxID=1232801 RepID=A0A6A4W0E5_AMPAM|nr:Down syndrome cell adhesion molecule-like protein Dscam2 [Amphibalanus amphitrite]
MVSLISGPVESGQCRTLCGVAKLMDLRQKALSKLVFSHLNDLRDVFADIDPAFRGTEMQDANEFLLRLLDTMKDEVDARRSTDNPVRDNFHYQTLESYRCTKCHETVLKRQENISWFVSVPHHQGTEAPTLQDALRLSMRPDRRHLLCQHCRHDECYVTTKISQLPRTLILQLNRCVFLGDEVKKIRTKVSIPKFLSLNEFVADDVTRPPEWNCTNPSLYDKYHMLPSGELLVRDVTSDDVTDRFLCRTVHLLTDQHVTSEPSARVVIRERTPSPGGILPVIVASSSALHVRAGDDAVLFCVAQSDERTPPRVSWTRDVTGRPEPVPAPVTGHGDVTASGHVLAIRSARPRHAGWYHCRADGGNGHVTEKLRLHVQVTPTVSVSPERLTVNRGSSFSLSCWAPQPSQLHWLKDGVRLNPGRLLSITHDSTDDRVLSRLEGSEMRLVAQGMYQCMASDQLDSAQAAAQVLLGDSQPVLVERFINHTVQPHSAVSLRCVANASPTPQITWLLDGYPLTADHR